MGFALGADGVPVLTAAGVSSIESMLENVYIDLRREC